MKPCTSCLLLILLLVTSCTGLRNNLLFRTERSINPAAFALSAERANRGYTISPNDRIAISVFTNEGERLIDPNREFEIGKGTPAQAQGQNMQQMGMGANDPNSFFILPFNSNNAPPQSYLIDPEGNVELPQIGMINLQDMTLGEAAKKLEDAFGPFYEQPFVKVQYLNKRVILMGALGDQVVPLRNENMTLLEVLAIAGGFQERSKPNNIRIIRGDLQDPSVQIVDLTTIEGMKKANLLMEPDDIVYVEPRRRLDRESVRDFNTLVAPISTIGTLALTILLFFRNP